MEMGCEAVKWGDASRAPAGAEVGGLGVYA